MRERSPERKSTAPDFGLSQAAQFGQKQADALLAMQRELYALVEEANRNWLSRAELERQLTAELVTGLSAAKSLPDAASIYQEWMSRRMKALAEDGQKLLADSQKFVTAATRFLSNSGGNSK